MKNKVKRAVSVVLVLATLMTFILCAISISAAEPLSPNVAMAEAVLHGKRQFVKKSLLYDDFSTNPHALVNGIGSSKSMMANSLSQYQNKDDPNYSAAYKAAVDIMEKVYNQADYTQSVSDYIVEFAASILEFFGLDASNLMGNLTKSVGEIRYESILKDALDADYTTSSGNKLSSKESELINLRRLENGVKNLSSFTSLIKSMADSDSGSAANGDLVEYYQGFLIPYGNQIHDVLSGFAAEQSSSGTGANEALITLVTALAMVEQGDRFAASSDEVGNTILTYCPTYFLDETTLDLIDFNNQGMKNASKALSSYMFIRSIQEQKDSLAGPLQRIADNTSDSDLKQVCTTFAKEITAAADSKTVKYDTVIRYLSQSGTVSKFVDKKLSDGIESAANWAGLGTQYSCLSSVFSKATNVVGISGWCADSMIGFESTCKKTYELKYLDKMISQAVSTCEKDIARYEKSKSDETAAAVLDDLQLIQKLRLRGEKISYSMMKGQFDSPVVKLIATGTLQQDQMLDEYLDTIYQYHVDALVGASIMPLTTESFTVKDGESLSLRYDESRGGMYGYFTKKDKSSYCIAEPQYRLANGITVSDGGSLTASSDVFYIPFIENRGGSILIGFHAQSLSELTQTSGMTRLGDGDFSIAETYLSGGEIIGGTSTALTCEKFTVSSSSSMSDIDIRTDIASVSGTLQLNGRSLEVDSQAKISGTIQNGDVYINGDLTGGTMDRLHISGSGTQAIEGTIKTGTIVYTNAGNVTQKGAVETTSLTYSNTGQIVQNASVSTTNLSYSGRGTITQNATANVSGNVQNPSQKVVYGQNTVLASTGHMLGSHYNSGITLSGCSLPGKRTIGGSLVTRGTVSLDEIEIDGFLKQDSGTLSLNGPVTVYSDVAFGGTATQTSGDFNAYGIISGKEAALGNLNLYGRTEQSIDSAVTVKNFHNYSKKLTVNDTVTVSGAAGSNGPIVNGKNIKMIAGSSFDGQVFEGDVTVNGLSGSLPRKLDGVLYLTGNMTQADSCTVNGLSHSGGTLTLTGNGSLTVNGFLKNTASAAEIAMEQGAVLNLNGDAAFSGPIKGGGTLNLKGSLSASSSIALENFNITAITPLTVEGGGEISTANLEILGNQPVTLLSTIKVSGSYRGNKKVVNPERIVAAQLNVSDRDAVYDGLLKLSGDLVIDGHTLTANGGLTLSGGSIVLTNGAKLIVNGKTTITGGSGKKITVDETSSAAFQKLALISNMGAEVNGSLRFGGDASLSSVTLSGGGGITVCSDLLGSSLTIDRPQNFFITGKTPQYLQCSGAKFENLSVENPCRGGVRFDGSVTCYGTLETGNTKITGTITQKETEESK